MATITTPTDAVLARQTSKAQRDAIRLGYGINDNPYQPDRTYIVFEATAGVNKLHIDTGATSNYFISKGDGTNELSYNDTGGTKDLTFETAGRYLIRIRGSFNGIQVGSDFVAVTQNERDKYIKCYFGTNSPIIIPTDSFNKCRNLNSITINHVTDILTSGFKECNLKEVYAPELVNIGWAGFRTNIELSNIFAPKLVSIGDSSLEFCESLQKLTLTYNAGFTVGNFAGTSVFLSDLYVKDANGTEAQEIEDKLTIKGFAKLNGYRLLY